MILKFKYVVIYLHQWCFSGASYMYDQSIIIPSWYIKMEVSYDQRIIYEDAYEYVNVFKYT